MWRGLYQKVADRPQQHSESDQVYDCNSTGKSFHEKQFAREIHKRQTNSQYDMGFFYLKYMNT